MIIRFLSYAIMLVTKLFLVIGSMRLDIVDLDRLAHVILLDWIKQWILYTVIMSILELTCGCLQRVTKYIEDLL